MNEYKLFSGISSANLKDDILSGMVIFLVALPLCLGIAQTCGVPIFAGLLSGIIGGLVVGLLSPSKHGVSGPAAGLISVVYASILLLGSFEAFLVALVISGVLQILIGWVKGGIIAYYFPSYVVKGMLTGIGIIIFLKQIPHLLGDDHDPEGDFAFFQVDGKNTFSEIIDAVSHYHLSAMYIGLISVAVLYGLAFLKRKFPVLKVLKGPIVVVILGVIYGYAVKGTNLEIGAEHLVHMPLFSNMDEFLGLFAFPDFSALTNINVWTVAITLALVSSMESLMCVEAIDSIDPDLNVTPVNGELIAQGIGNICSGLVGGLPVTQVAVRSSTNVHTGGKSTLASMVHAVLLIIAALTMPLVFNMIPISVLAAILVFIGLKLIDFKQIIEIKNQGRSQFIPFIVTVLGIVFINLLTGLLLGIAIGLIFILINSYYNSHFLHIEYNEGQSTTEMTLAEEVTFLNKGSIIKELNDIPRNSTLKIDVRSTVFLDDDIIEVLQQFSDQASKKNIKLILVSNKGTVVNPKHAIEFFTLRPSRRSKFI